MRRAVVGLDVGTTTVKAVAIASDGELIAKAASSPLQMQGGGRGWSTQRPSALVDAVFEALGTLVESVGESAELVGLSVACQSGSVVGIGAEDDAITELVTWMDTRAAGIVDGWHVDGTDARIRELSGWSAACGLGLSTIAWFSEDDTWSDGFIKRFAAADDLVIHALTGSWTTNRSNAAGMQLMDLRTGQWSEELCSLAGIGADMLSELATPGDVIGPTSREAMRRLGIKVPMTVVAGGHDQSCAGFGLGVNEPGRCLLATGTAWVLTTILSRIETAPPSMNLSHHVVADRFTASTFLGGFGASMSWWATANHTSPEALAAELDGAALEPGSPPPTFRPTGVDATGNPIPGAGTFEGAQMPTRPEGTIAVMHAAAAMVASALEGGPSVEGLTMIGGSTAGRVWPTIVANTTGLPVRPVNDESVGGRAAAAIAGTAVGMFPDVDSTAVGMFPDVDSLPEATSAPTVIIDPKETS